MKTRVTLVVSVLMLLPALTMASGVDASLFSTSSPDFNPERAWLDCTGPFTEFISCGVPISGTTVSRPNWADTYNCTTETLDGNEVVHVLTLAQLADITATLTAFGNPAIDVLILDDCDTTACVAYDDEEATYESAPAGTYYIVVDGQSAYNGSYTLSVDCEYLPTPTPSPTPTEPPVPSTTSAGILILVLGMTLILGLLTWKFAAARP